MAKTRPGQKGVGVRPYGGFSPKSPASGPKSSDNVTRLLSIGIGGRKRLGSNKGTGPFTRLTSMGINGRRVAFEPKNPIIPPEEAVVTRLLTYGIGGKRVAFLPKGPSEPTSGGTTKSWRYKFTKEHLRELEQFGIIRDGVMSPDDIPKAEEILEVESLEVYSESLSDLIIEESQQISEITILKTDEFSIQEKIADEEDIGLILAIIETHLGG